MLAWRFLLGPRLAGELLQGSAVAPAPPPGRGAALRVVTWNLHNFPSAPDEREAPEAARRTAAVREQLTALDADVLALQEVRDPAALQDLLPEHRVLASKGGGHGGQHVVVAFDARRVELLGEPVEVETLTMQGRLRPALDVTLRLREQGPDLHVVVVHLKATPDGLPLRTEQWEHLVEYLRAATDREDDLLLLGDFNTTGARDAVAAEELEALAQVLAQAGLRRVPADLECSAYWDGPRRDAWKIPTLLDHVWSRGLAESGVERARVAVHGACRRHACADLRSTPAHPDPDYALASDHCPLLLELEPGDDDDPGEPPKTGPGATLPPS